MCILYLCYLWWFPTLRTQSQQWHPRRMSSASPLPTSQLLFAFLNTPTIILNKKKIILFKDQSKIMKKQKNSYSQCQQSPGFAAIKWRCHKGSCECTCYVIRDACHCTNPANGFDSVFCLLHLWWLWLNNNNKNKNEIKRLILINFINKKYWKFLPVRCAYTVARAMCWPARYQSQPAIVSRINCSCSQK